MVQDERIEVLRSGNAWAGKYVIYWMQSAQRAEYNHALEYAVEQANSLKKPLIVLFVLTAQFPQANLRHYYFMLEGLQEVEKKLRSKGVGMLVRYGEPSEVAAKAAEEASLVVVDSGQLRVQRKWRESLARRISCPLHQVETNLIVPVETACDKESYSAAAIRGRIKEKLDGFLVKMRHSKPRRDSLGIKLNSLDISDIEKVLRKLDIDRSVEPVNFFRSGTSQAKKLLKKFIKYKLDDYGEKRNDPCADCVSHMSPYLHFGQISPVYIALEVMKTDSTGKDAYLEELIIRRELSHNFVWYNEKYDSFKCLPNWARNTLNFHNKDKRAYNYSLRKLEDAETHDEYWNAAQREMVITGKMHPYMRMYWGKKILEWTSDVREAFKRALYLNNKYELDGRDANSFAGIAWCFGKHDTPWPERPVFGKTRYMNAAGLKRKFDPDEYVRRINIL